MPTLALSIAGSIIGAGFASGQELWQFFGVFGIKGIIGLILSLFLFALLCSLFLLFCKKRGIFSYEDAVFPTSHKLVRKAFALSENILFYFLAIIMTAGAMEVCRIFFSPATCRIIGALFALTVAFFTLFGLGSVTKVFSFFVPLLVVSSAVIFIILLSKSGVNFNFKTGENAGLLNNWFLSSLLYVSYSFFASVGILAPLSKHIKTRKGVLLGSAIASVLLGIISFTILLSIALFDPSRDASLPMLAISSKLSLVLGGFYAVILLGAMFAASLTSSVAFFEWTDTKITLTPPVKVIAVFAFSATAYLFSLFGFKSLISTVYPIFGYIGFIVIGAVFFNALRRNKNG